MVTMRTFQGISNALEAARVWMLMVVDQTEIRSDAQSLQRAIDLTREGPTHDSLRAAVTERDELPTWFEREMERQCPPLFAGIRNGPAGRVPAKTARIGLRLASGFLRLETSRIRCRSGQLPVTLRISQESSAL
jgi:hypothetical protein